LDLSSDLPEGHTHDYFRNVHFVLSIDELARYLIFRDRLGKRKVSN